MIYTNARLILPDGVHDGLELSVRDGKIAAITAASGGGEKVDCCGNYIAPGFIDVHVHGALGRDTMEGSPEAFRAICDYHASGGTTSLLLTIATAPLDDIERVLRAIGSAIAELPQVAGAHVEGPFISPQRPGAQRSEFICEPDEQATSRLLQFTDIVKRITIAPEIPHALDCIRAFRAAGIAVSGGHSDAWDEDARAAFSAGMRHVTHTFNCMSSARKRGRERVAGLLEFALSEPDVMCELIADGHHVSTTLMKMLWRAKGAAGICVVTDATAGAGLPDGTRFDLAGKSCVVRGGVCLLTDGSALAGSAARMSDLVRTIVQEVGVPLHHAIAMAASNPARAAGLETKGRLEAGADADFIVLSPQCVVLQTFAAGREIFRRDN